jgi:hypothetical protein
MVEIERLIKSLAGIVLMGLLSVGPATSESRDELVSKILAESTDVLDIRKSLDELETLDFDAYLSLAPKLMRGGDKRIAIYVVKRLTSSIIMMGSHKMHGAAPSGHDMTFVDKVVAVLRGELSNPSADVRNVAISYLVAAGQDDVLGAISGLVKEGVISDTEALGYFLASGSPAAVPFLKTYAETAEPQLSSKAVSYLSSDVTQQSYVREQFLVNEKSEDVARVAALENLAKYDGQFATYATSPDVLQFALGVQKLASDPSKSGEQLILQAVKKEISKNPSVEAIYRDSIEKSAAEVIKRGVGIEASRIQEMLKF